MKRNFLKVLVAVLSLGVIGIFAAGCSFGGIEQPEWLQQALCDHVETYVEAVEPTCTKAGNTNGAICEDCGKVLEGVWKIPALGHTETVTKEAVSPTCTTIGYTAEVTCNVCSEVLQEAVELIALGHTYAGDTCTVCGSIDMSNYTEVEAEVGEKVAGYWYRLYRGDSLGTNSGACYSATLIIDGQDVSFGVSASNHENCGGLGICMDEAFVRAGGSPHIYTMDIPYVMHDDYVDIYMGVGTYSTSNSNPSSFTVTADSVITEFSGKVVKLIPNNETGGNEEDAIDEALTPANLDA